MSPSGRKGWRIRISEVDHDDELGAGLMMIDPSTPWESLPATAAHTQQRCPAFGPFVRLMRRRLGLTVEMLASDADVEIADLARIENGPWHQPEVRTVYQLAGFFAVSRTKLMQVAGLTGPMDPRLFNAAVRFVKWSDSRAAPRRAGNSALAAFVVALSDDL
jgi:transcriptional regulator with XRE-family HTH domain